jgi:hypothetical protein
VLRINSAEGGAKGQPGQLEARNPKFETISNDKKTQCPKQTIGLEFCTFNISNFEIVSDFEFRISDFDSVALLAADLSFPHGCGIKRSMERIEPQQDHKWLNAYLPGQQVRFQGKVYKIQRRTTLASGEAAVVLEGEKEQFVISAAKFLAGLT